MSDLEKFLQECEINSTHGCNDTCCPPMHKLLAMVRLLKKEICLLDNCSKCGHHDQYLCEHYDTMQQLNKIARGEK